MAYYKPSGRLISFKRFCIENGINLLSDDLRFIEKMLYKIDSSDFKPVLMGYVEKWRSGMGENVNASQSQNLGRKNANLWLMERCSENRKEKNNYLVL